MNKAITLDQEQKLYIIPCVGGGYSCLGFNECERRTVGLQRELAARGHSVPAPAPLGTLERYEQYRAACDVARQDNAATGWRSASQLTPQLIGLEGRRVEVLDKDGLKRRFQVGRSTGFIPCHLEIARRGCHGGGAAHGAPYQSIRIIR